MEDALIFSWVIRFGGNLLNRPIAGLLGAVAARACIKPQLATDRGLVAYEQTGDLRDAVLGFNMAGNLVSFNLAEVFVIHRVTSTFRSGRVEC